MPKSRYRIMARLHAECRRARPRHDARTCTVQVNLDFSSEADMRDKLRVGLALQPIATALFANSPFTENRPNGFVSLRAEIWRDTDTNRTGMLPFAFLDGFGFERLRRLGARRADVFRRAGRALSRHDGAHVPRSSWPAMRRTTCPTRGRRWATGRTISRRSSPRCG